MATPDILPSGVIHNRPVTIGELRSADLVYADVPYGTGRRQVGSAGTYSDGHAAAVEFATGLLENDECTTIIHCDQRLKWDLPKPQVEIIWGYHSGGASKKMLPQKHDSLLVYNVSHYSPVRIPYQTPGTAGRQGFHPDGKMATSWWGDIGIISTTGRERVGYPTQKPVRLLTRVLEMWCPAGGVVIDPCCGSGTTLVAAERLGVSWVGYDINPEAVAVATERIEAERSDG